jgi:hypothetical protein
MSEGETENKERTVQSAMGGRERTAQKMEMMSKYKQPWDLVCDQETLKVNVARSPFRLPSVLASLFSVSLSLVSLLPLSMPVSCFA